MTKDSIKFTFNAEKYSVAFSLIKEIVKNQLINIPAYRSWQHFYSRYIDLGVIGRKQNVDEFEKRFGANYFEILFAIHLVVYSLGKNLLRKINVPAKLEKEVSEDLFEDALMGLSNESKYILTNQIETQTGEFNLAVRINSTNICDLFELIYRAISPKQIRKPLGEYFTPFELAVRMVDEVDLKYKNGLWMDNSSGFGVFLLAYLKRFGIARLKDFICIELSPLSVFVSKVALLYEYREQLSKIQSLTIHWGDVLLNQRYQYKSGQIEVAGNFSDLFGNVRVVIGNPPWVNWKSMTQEYQDLIGDDWRSYDIFEKKITRRKMGAYNDDISSYFIYSSIDRFLENRGLLKFITNLSLFKSNLAGRQFRQFYIRKSNTPFRVSKIYDLSSYKIFREIGNSYCIFEAEKGERTEYPIDYAIICSNKGGKVQTIEAKARPENNEDGGALIVVRGKDSHLESIQGQCEYMARAGVCTWLNGVYWVKILEKNRLIKIVNLGNVGKIRVGEFQAEIEGDLLYRLLRARNLADFRPIIGNCIIVAQQKDNLSKPIPEDLMKRKYNNAYNFLLNFKSELLGRSGYNKFLTGKPFYALYNIGPYTMSPIKIAWQFVSKNFRVYLIDHAEDIIPDLNVMFIPLDNYDEAYYLHALLNSKYAKEKIESSSHWTFPSGCIQNMYLEKYSKDNQLHVRICTLERESLLGKDIDHSKEMDKLFKEYWFSDRDKKREVRNAQLSLL